MQSTDVDSYISDRDIMKILAEVCRVAGIRKIVIDYPPDITFPDTQILFQRSYGHRTLTIEDQGNKGQQLELFKDKPNVQFW